MAVASHQKRWETSAALFREFVAQHGHPNVPIRHIVGDVGLNIWLNNQRQVYRRGELAPERVTVLFDIHPEWNKAIRKRATWETSAELFRVFVAENGHANVPALHVVDGIRLGTWVYTQRRAHQQGSLSPERLAVLHGIHREWATIDIFAARWETNAELFRAFVAQHGHTNVPIHHIADSVKLGMWLSIQRYEYRRGNLKPRRAAALNGIHSKWHGNASRAEKWEANAELFRAFVAEHGHANVPKKFTVDGAKLGMWLNYQRHAYRRGSLAPERVAALNKIHSKWLNAIGRATQWEANVELFRAFVAEHGHVNVPERYIVGGVKLDTWLRSQRHAYRRGSLAPERVAALNKIHSKWHESTSRAEKWEANAELFRAFVAQHGHPDMPVHHIADEVRLGLWLSVQRHKYRRGDLAPERATALNEIHPQWIKTSNR